MVDAFSQAATYDEYAVVQRIVAARLADNIASLPLLAAPRVCEIGCGTGFLGESLGQRLPGVSWLATDISPAMVKRAQRRLEHDPRFAFATLDAENPSDFLAGRQFDLICSTFAAQWFSDFGAALERLSVYLKPGGRLLLTTLAQGTFSEWRRAHVLAGLNAGAWRYPSLDEIASKRPPTLVGHAEQDTYQEVFPDARAFLRALRGIGADTKLPGSAPLSAGQMRQVMRHFEAAGSTITYVVATCRFERR